MKEFSMKFSQITLLNKKKKICKVYEELYKKKLSKELHEELGGFYEDVCQALILDPFKYSAINVNKIISKYEPNMGMEKALIGMFTLRTKQEISDIKGFYKLEQDTDMEEDLLSKLGANNAYKPLIASLLQYSRDPPETPVDEDMANKDAQSLNEDGLFKGKQSSNENPAKDDNETNADENNEDDNRDTNDERKDDKEEEASDSGVGKDLQEDENINCSLFHKILFKKTQRQILATLKQYEEISGSDIKTSLIMERLSDRESNAYVQLIERITDPSLFFASELEEALKGMESDDDTIVRVMVLRSEVDLRLVEKKYKEAFNKDLSKSIAQATGGDYQKILIKILKPRSK